MTPAGREPLLEVRRVWLRRAQGKGFALRRVTLKTGRAGVVGVIGPKASGKTALLDVISGLARPTSGKVLLDGEEVTSDPAHARAARGIGRTHAPVGLARDASVIDDLRMALHTSVHYDAITGAVGSPDSYRQETVLTHRARTILRDAGLAHREDARVGELPYTELKRLELAAVMASDPRVVLLDEPGAGGHPDDMLDLAGEIRSLAGDGRCVIVADSFVPFVFLVADRVVCLDRGRVVASGSPARVRTHPGVARAFLGERSPRTADDREGRASR